MSVPTSKIGIALSGGGYRAAAFHLGTLKKLNELGVLIKADVLSTISGGSITGASYCTSDKSFHEFYSQLYNSLNKKDVIKSILLSWMGLRFLGAALLLVSSFVLLFTAWPWLFPVVFASIIVFILKYQFVLFPVSNRIEQAYNNFFFDNKTLGQLNEKPFLIMGATNLQTARPFSFSKTWMQDSTYQFLDNPVEFRAGNFPLARAVMASTCVPFAFTPVTIKKEFFQNPAEAEKYHPALVDGGVYDNQGIHRIMQKGKYECGYVITSDAGCGSSGEMRFKNTFSLLMETVNVFMSRIKKAQMARNVYDNATTENKQVAYFSLGWDAENCIDGFITNLAKKQITDAVINAHELLPEWKGDAQKYRMEIKHHLQSKVNYAAIVKPSTAEKKIARNVNTNLKALKKEQLDALIKQAEALTEVQVKLYCPSLVN